MFHKLKAGRPLLHLAAQEGQRGILQLLLSAGVQVSTLDERSETAAYWACQNGHLECIDYLISEGLDLKAGKTDLMEEAIKKGRLSVVESLMDQGLPIKKRHPSLLHGASDIHHKRWDMLYFLLRHLQNPQDPVEGDADRESEDDAYNPESYLSFEFPILAAAHIDASRKVGRLDSKSCAFLLFTCAEHGFLSGPQALLEAAAPSLSEVRKYYVEPHGWRALEVAA